MNKEKEKETNKYEVNDKGGFVFEQTITNRVITNAETSAKSRMQPNRCNTYPGPLRLENFQYQMYQATPKAQSYLNHPSQASNKHT